MGREAFILIKMFLIVGAVVALPSLLLAKSEEDLEIKPGEDLLAYANRLVEMQDVMNETAVKAEAAGDVRKAIALLEKNIEFQKKILGEDHVDIAGSKVRLARQYEEIRQFDQARKLLVESLDIMCRQPFSHFHEIDARYELDDFDRRRTMTEDEKVLFEELKELDRLRKKALEKRNRKQVTALTEETLAIREKLLGTDHPEYFLNLNKLCTYYLQAEGSAEGYASTEPLCEECCHASRRALGRGHPYHAWALRNLGHIHLARGELDRAEALLLESVFLWEMTMGRMGGRNYFLIVSDLQSIYLLKKEPVKFAYFYNLSRFAGRGKAERTGLCAHILYNRAESACLAGDLARADEILEKAVMLSLRSYGGDHPQTAYYQSRRAEIAREMGDFEQARMLHEAVLASYRRNLSLASTFHSETQQLEIVHRTRMILDSFLSFASSSGVSGADIYRKVLPWKGTVFAQQRRMRFERQDPGINQLFRRLQLVTGLLASSTLSDSAAGLRVDKVRDLEKERSDLIRRLSNRSETYRRVAGVLLMEPSIPIRSLPTDTVLVDFLVFNWKSGGKDANTKKDQRERHLAAFVVRKDRPVEFVDLGPVEPIRKAIAKWREKVCGKDEEMVAGRGKEVTKSVSAPNLDMSRDSTGSKLRKLLWEPLAGKAAGARLVLISPDGCLGCFPFGALPGSAPGSYLVEEVAVAYIPTAQLLPDLSSNGQPASAARSPASLFVVGGVDFNAAQQGSQATEAGRIAVRGSSWKDFKALAHSGKESDQVKELFNRFFPGGAVIALSGRAAVEQAFREEAGEHRFIHLATHGFFAPAEVTSALAELVDHPGDPVFEPMSRGLPGYHPGLLSGIVFAGANEKQPEGRDDGIFTALEMAAGDLSKVELMVLSACQTGLGVATGGEGHIGLLRAAQLAGARTVVASLWKVNDEKTKQLMGRFYDSLWSGGATKLEALRRMQLDLIKQGAPVREWAAWILSGDWR